MTIYTLRRETWVRRPIAETFDFFSRAENLAKLTPSWIGFRIETPLPIEMRAGALIAYRLRVRGIPLKWLTEIESWNPPYEFVDVQVTGPYKRWHHTHQFRETLHGTHIVDVVDYALPFAALGRIVHRLQVAGDLAQIFDYREKRIHELLD